MSRINTSPDYATRDTTRKANNAEFMRFLCLFRQVQVLLSAVQKKSRIYAKRRIYGISQF